ncbi:MAG: diguanylate cyclase [Myxococcales bacterium]|nr:diguanylate cyclase [Myxococcales bacterium]
MARIVLVDDSPSVLSLLRPRLEAAGHEVRSVSDAYAGADLTLADPPDVVITDLWMPGMSGLQLCRMLRAEPETAHVPVVLLTASDDKRSRFWADRSGAAAFVTKQGVGELLHVVDSLVRSQAGRVRPPPSSRRRPAAPGSMQNRLAHLLDGALYDSVLAGEVRSLASAGSYEALASGVARLLAQLVDLRCIALEARPASRAGAAVTIVVGRSELAKALCEEAQGALGALDGLVFLPEGLASTDAPGQGAVLHAIDFGEERLGRMWVAPAGHRFGPDDERVVGLVARELGGPLRMATLVTDAQRLAATDSLTGLLNRRAFVEVVARDVSLAHRHSSPLSLLLLDLDHFKQVNDVYGHAVGDLVLSTTAGALAQTVRKSDLVARWGGEEFVVALSHTAASGARVMAERLRRQIADRAIALPDRTFNVTSSIGVASLGPNEDLDGLLVRADRAMYQAKSKGRNRVESV